jgi:hypothetical protein
MPIILNLITREYFIANDKKEQNMYLKKLLSRVTLEEFQICWKYVSTITTFKSVIEWNRTDKIIEVPPHIENFVLNNKKYHQISLINLEFEPLGAMLRACDPRTKKDFGGKSTNLKVHSLIDLMLANDPEMVERMKKPSLEEF